MGQDGTTTQRKVASNPIRIPVVQDIDDGKIALHILARKSPKVAIQWLNTTVEIWSIVTAIEYFEIEGCITSFVHGRTLDSRGTPA